MAVKSFSVKQHQSAVSPRVRRAVTRGSFEGVLSGAQKSGERSVPAGVPYTVRPGDTLSGIASRLKKAEGIPRSTAQIVKELTVTNRLPDPDLIISGQTVYIPRFPRDGAAATRAYGRVSTEPDRGATPPPAAAARTGARVAGLLDITDPSTQPAPPEPIPPAADDAPGEPRAAAFPPGAPRGEIQGGVGIRGAGGESAAAFGTVAAAPGERDPAPLPSLAAGAEMTSDVVTQMEMYKEDQLLAHPGGDYYFLNRTSGVYDPAYGQKSFAARVGKDLSDAGSNLLNIARDLTTGSRFKFVAANGVIVEGRRPGLFGTVKDFFQDLASGLTFGAYMPPGENPPRGAAASIWHFFKKVFYDAPVKDILVGVPQAGLNVAKDAAFALMNAIEVVPDATIGNFDWGQKLTTTVFDNGQVVVDYLTDIVPGGNAWLRVHAAGGEGRLGLPVLFSLQAPEQGMTDSRWVAVRNTPFRKTIETVGSLLSDAFAVISAGTQLHTPSSDHKKP